MLLLVACLQDKEWLAGTPSVHSANPAQAAWERYQRAWAQRKKDGSQEGLPDVAKVLADLVKSPSPPPWAGTELRNFVNDMDQALHIEFGEADAVVLAPTITVLLQADVLELTYRIVFGIQAATHIAYFLSKDDGVITPVYEQLLFDTVRLYANRQAELPDEDKEYVAGEVTKGVMGVSAVTADALTKAKDAIADRYNALVQRQRYADEYQLQRIFQAKREILNGEFKPLRDRLSRYHVLLGQVPLSDVGRQIRKNLGDALKEWGDEISGLGG
jgi:hypothetical protein